jgi:uncharacterized membrane protein
MNTKLIFFGNYRDTIEGTKRGAIAFITLILLDNIRFKIMDYSKVVTKKPVNITSALFVWLLLCSAIAVQQDPTSYREAVIYGMLVGLVVYGVYNGTNYSILKGWTPKVAILDTLWGVFVCGMASLAVYCFYHKNKSETLTFKHELGYGQPNNYQSVEKVYTD